MIFSGNRLDNLVRKAKKLNDDALAAIYDEFMPKVFRYVYYQVNDRVVAEDLTSETFLKMLTAIKDFREDGKSFYPWLLRIAKNTTFDYLRTKAKHSHSVFGEDIEEIMFDRSSTVDLEHTVMTGLDADEVKEAATKLTGEQQQVLLLRFTMGLSNGEAARVLDKTEGSVKALQVRALASLRRIMKVSTGEDERVEPRLKEQEAKVFRKA
jgi:RNA polymerase sigma-70 factor, ECF subfamily